MLSDTVLILAAGTALAIFSGIAAYGSAKERRDRYEVASPERTHVENRDQRVIIDYDGQNYVLMYNRRSNRPELFPANEE